MKKLRPLILFVIGGLIYVFIELTARGRSHWTMFVVGGLAFFLIGCINEKYRKMPLVKQMAIGATVITILEFVCGCIVNIWLGWNVWDYTGLPFQFMGQICLPFIIIFSGLCSVGIMLTVYSAMVLSICCSRDIRRLDKTYIVERKNSAL